MDNQFAWVDFYKEFANKLLEYKNKRDQLIDVVSLKLTSYSQGF